MTISTLDAQTALIVLDLQKAIMAYPTTTPIGDIASNAGALAEAFRRSNLPVVLVNVAGAAPGRTEQPRRTSEMPPELLELLPQLNQQPSDYLLTKRTWGAFTETGLKEHLCELGVTQVVLAGVATSIGVESTARQAQEAGFNVALAVDAMADASEEAHANSVTRIFPRLGETGTVADILRLLDRVHG
jgi:nicotinamidase-related amidase